MRINFGMPTALLLALSLINSAGAVEINTIDAFKKCLSPEYREVMLLITNHESTLKPYAINVNGQQTLKRQPRSKEEAISWSKQLIRAGYSIDMGAGQVNSQHFMKNGRFQGRRIEDAFDVCKNLKMSAVVFGEAYNRNKGDIVAALSTYNTGNQVKGVKNGYVGKVLSKKNIDQAKKILAKINFDQSNN
ncbi:MAG: transglycosylase SLT domain-containing protein [Proteobacteria bacterium]|nr:transglycosylase SLT domain-containing protein [Pseudomonadota bacterium]